MEFKMNVCFLAVVMCVLSCGVLACDENSCRAKNGMLCNNQGQCDCGVCRCVDPYSGPTCEDTPIPPCDVFRGCVSCKIFGTGDMSIIDCLDVCDYIATYYPVDEVDFDSSNSNDTLCQTLNDNCLESFRIGGITDGYRDLYVRTTCEFKYTPIEPTVLDVSVDITDAPTRPATTPKTAAPTKAPVPTTKPVKPTANSKVTTEESDDFNDMNDSKRPVNVAAVAGSSRDNSYDNSAHVVTFSKYGALMIMFLLFLLS